MCSGSLLSGYTQVDLCVYLPSYEALFEAARKGQDAAADALAVAEAASPDAARALARMAESARIERVLGHDIKVKRDKVAKLTRAVPAAQVLAVASKNAASPVSSGNTSAHRLGGHQCVPRSQPALATPSEPPQLLHLSVTSHSTISVSLNLDTLSPGHSTPGPDHVPHAAAVAAGASDAKGVEVSAAHALPSSVGTRAPGRAPVSRSRKFAAADYVSAADRLQAERAALTAMEAVLKEARTQHEVAAAEAASPLLKDSVEGIHRCRVALDRAKVQVDNCKKVVHSVSNVLRADRSTRYSNVVPVARARIAVVRCYDVQSKVRLRSPVRGWGLARGVPGIAVFGPSQPSERSYAGAELAGAGFPLLRAPRPSSGSRPTRASWRWPSAPSCR